MIQKMLEKEQIQNQVYQQMYSKFQKQNLLDIKDQIEISSQKDNINHAYSEVFHINQVENQRQIQLENISFDFQSKMDINRSKTELLIKERKVT